MVVLCLSFVRVMSSGFATSQSSNIYYLGRAHFCVDVMPHALSGSPTLVFSSQVSPRPPPRAQTSIRWTLYILGFVLSTICGASVCSIQDLVWSVNSNNYGLVYYLHNIKIKSRLCSQSSELFDSKKVD